MGLMLSFHIKLNYLFCPLVEKIEALVVGVFQYFSDTLVIKHFSGGMLVFS